MEAAAQKGARHPRHLREERAPGPRRRDDRRPRGGRGAGAPGVLGDRRLIGRGAAILFKPTNIQSIIDNI